VCSEEQLDQVIGEPVFNKKTEKFLEIFKSVEFKLNAKEYFQFFKEYKKNIVKVEFKNNSIKITTSIPDVIYEEDNNLNNLKKLSKTINNIEKDISDKESLEFEFNYDLFEKIKSNSSSQLSFDVENKEIFINSSQDNLIKLRIAPKYFLITKTSKCAINIYNKNENTYIMEISVDDKKFKAKQYLKFLNYNI
jgi:hypothetical protein